jgi:alkylated DNA repair dioxygenase AlkB
MSTSQRWPPPIDGLRYIPEYLTSEVENVLLEAADTHEWQLADHSGRRFQVYGFHYNHKRVEAYPIGELPMWTRDLAMRLRDDGLIPTVPNQLVANDYPAGSGLFGHIDQAVFGDTIVSVSLGSACGIRFSHVASGRVEECVLEARSALVLSGDARWNWKHEIPARRVDIVGADERPRSRRVSLTFRAVPTSPASGANRREAI